MKILLIGKGYIGQEFLHQMADAQFEHECYYSSHDAIEIAGAMGKIKPDVVINSAAFIPHPSVSACDQEIEATLRGNLILPSDLAVRCLLYGSTLLHISTGCLFEETKNHTEIEQPTRGFKDHCGVYVGMKLVAEECVGEYERHYICRIRLPFDRFDNDRNYLSKLAKYPKVYDHLNSLSHREDCVKAMLDLVTMKAPYGTYHVCNPGAISAREVVAMMDKKGLIHQDPSFVPGPCPGCTLSVDKLLSTGVKIRPVQEAVRDAIENWRSQ